jgi:hypothetical protein
LDVNLSSKIWFISFSGFPIAARRRELGRIWGFYRVWKRLSGGWGGGFGEARRRMGKFVGDADVRLGELD